MKLSDWLPIVIQTLALLSAWVGGIWRVMQKLDTACNQIEAVRQDVEHLKSQLGGTDRRVDAVNARVDFLFAVTGHREADAK